ncbi:hypothetical protein SAMN02745126_05656 [Enhydrobacter aerosaccus]|uniref:Antifreeze glycopeptide polyprotein n=1 Tax=Enhydrobacter aerosaccus TaxID=225324 RepID=A0A1T4T429_9HYPH|nr:hypothetical protein [Enhydrobacter aerosaccus]SKA35213.1 hypothetical protein SAMN02745126_05656 [Enhydrobacter aerosaccus]
MTDLRISLAVAVTLAFGAHGAFAQSPSFDDRPTGFLTEKTGGMPADAWGDTRLGTAKRLVSALPAAPRSRALRDLQFEVMVSLLTPPVADASPPPTLFARKVDRLAAMGEGESLNEMVRSAGGYVDPSIAATVTNAMMMAGERAGACAVAENNALAQPFGQRAEIACMLARGDTGGALGALSALRSTDPSFAALVKIVAEGSGQTVAPAGTLDGPAMVLIYMAHLVPPASALSTTQPPLIRALVGQPALPMASRIEIAERGEALAVIEATRLADLYMDALREGAALPPAMARRAQLVAAARNAANPTEIMNAVRAVYTETNGSPLFPTIARASASALLNLPAKPEYAGVAQEAIRGFLLLGDKKLTRAWTQLALQAAYNNAGAMNALDHLMPLIEIAGIDNGRNLVPEDVNRWYGVIRQDDPRAAPMRGYLLLELFRAVGFEVPPKSTELPEAPPPGVRLVMPPAATLQALQAAGAAHRQAEAALLASDAIGDTPLTELHPAAVGIIVRSLRQAGEATAARLFAIETAIAHGL